MCRSDVSNHGHEPAENPLSFPLVSLTSRDVLRSDVAGRGREPSGGFRIIQGGTVNIDPMLGGLTVIPEPGSVALAAGALCLGLLRRKRA